jgi:hypothetical protein
MAPTLPAVSFLLLCEPMRCADLRSWAEVELRKLEKPSDSFAVWQKKLVKAVSAYPAKGKLVGSMARKCAETLKRNGGPIDD